MKRAALIISTAFNVALVVAAFHWSAKPGAPLQLKVEPKAVASVFSPEPLALNSVPTPELVRSVTNRFHWGLLASEDYEKYVANLRQVGCPEKTIRDIMVAAVQRRYALRTATLPQKGDFWASGAQRAAADRAREQQERALEAEQRALLLRLVGFDCAGQMAEHNDDLVEQAIIRYLLGPLPDGVPEQVLAAIQKGETLEKEIEARANGILLPAHEAEIRQARAARMAELQRLLSPAQFEEFTARSAAINLADHSLEHFRMTAAELHEIARLHASVFGLNDEKPFDLFGNNEGSDEKTVEFEGRLKQFLGESRYAEYQRENDPAFRSLRSMAEQNKVPEETVLKIYALKQLAQTEQQRLRDNPNLAAAEREASLSQVQDTTFAAVQSLLGAQALANYLHQDSSQWVTNVNQLAQ